MDEETTVRQRGKEPEGNGETKRERKSVIEGEGGGWSGCETEEGNEMDIYMCIYVYIYIRRRG